MVAVATTAVAATLIGFLFVAGLVAARVFASGRAWREEDWLDAPFLALAVVVLVLQNAAYVGVPARWAAWLLLAFVLFASAVIVRRGGLHGLYRSCPARILVVSVAVYVVHAFGLWLVGAGAYTGRGWGDQINYSALAHYLTDFVYGTRPSPDQPAAALGYRYIDTRMGQSFLLAFFGTILHRSPKFVFEPTILLGPLLLTLAIAAHGIRAGLPRWLGLLLAIFAGSLPAVAFIHLESFLSQALAMPGLLYFPVLLDRAASQGDFADYLRAGIVFAGTTSIYLEYFPLLAACATTFVVVCSFRNTNLKGHALGMSAVIALPFVLQASHGLFDVMRVVSGEEVLILSTLYPWAVTLEGIQRLWAGDFIGATIDSQSMTAGTIALALTALGFYGLIRRLGCELTNLRTDRGRFPSVAGALCTVGIAAFPLAILVWDARYQYHFYKALLLAAPLLAWGVGYELWADLSWVALPLRRALVAACVVPFAALAVAGTCDAVRASTDATLPEAEVIRRRQNANPLTLDQAFLTVESELEKLSNRDVVVCVSDNTWNAGHVNGWFAMAARHNRTWLLNRRINDNEVSRLSGEAYLLDTPGASTGLVVVATTTRGLLWPLHSRNFDFRTRLTVGSYEIFEPASTNIAFLCHPLLAQQDDGSGNIALRLPAEPLRVFSSALAKATLFVKHNQTPNPAQSIRALVDGHSVQLFAHSSGLVGIPINLAAGVTSVALEPTESTPAALLANISLSLSQDSLRIGSVENPNGLETVNGKPFFWMGRGITALEVFSPSAGQCDVHLDTLVGPSVSRTGVRRLRVWSDVGSPLYVSTSGGAVSFRVPVQTGWARISIEPLDKPDTVIPQDSRPLLLGVRQVSARLGADQ